MHQAKVLTLTVLTPRALIDARTVSRYGWLLLPTDITIPFSNSEHYGAMYDAEDWARARGYAIGPCQGELPRGLVARGLWRVPRWSALRNEQRDGLDGVMLATAGSLRRGPIFIRLRETAAIGEPRKH